jgi:hypothetical protein
MLRTAYGRHAAVRRQQEAAVLSQFQRLPGIESSFSGLDTILGRDTTFDAQDMFENPAEKADRSVNVHLVMEAKLGL